MSPLTEQTIVAQRNSTPCKLADLGRRRALRSVPYVVGGLACIVIALATQLSWWFSVPVIIAVVVLVVLVGKLLALEHSRVPAARTLRRSAADLAPPARRVPS